MKTLLTQTSPNAKPVYHLEFTQEEVDIVSIGLIRAACGDNPLKIMLMSSMLHAVPYEVVVKHVAEAKIAPENEFCIKLVSSIINLRKSQQQE